MKHKIRQEGELGQRGNSIRCFLNIIHIEHSARFYLSLCFSASPSQKRTPCKQKRTRRSHHRGWTTGTHVTSQPPTLGSQYFFLGPTLLWALPTQPGGRLATVRGKPSLSPHLLLIPIPLRPPAFLPPILLMHVCMWMWRGAKRKRWTEERNGRRDGGRERVGGSGREREEKPDSVGRTFIHQLHSRWHLWTDNVFLVMRTFHKFPFLKRKKDGGRFLDMCKK